MADDVSDPAPPPPPVPSPDAQGGYTVYGDMDAIRIGSLVGGDIESATSTELHIDAGSSSLHLDGQGFTYDRNEQLTGGSFHNLFYTQHGGLIAIQIIGPTYSVGSLPSLIYSDNS